MSEAIRLFARLRQMFEFRQWRTGPSLVSDFRFSLRARVYPRRDVAAAMSRGDFTRGVRLAYQLMVRTLTRRGYVPRSPGLTTGECRGAVARAKPEIGSAVSDATRTFERVIYGKQPAEVADVENILQAEREATRA